MIGSDPAVHECWTISAIEGLIQRLQVYGGGIAEHTKDEPRPPTQETFCRRDMAPRLCQLWVINTALFGGHIWVLRRRTRVSRSVVIVAPGEIP